MPMAEKRRHIICGGQRGELQATNLDACGYLCEGMIVNEKGAVAWGTWRQEHFAKARHVNFAEDISIINVPIDPEARIPIKNSLNVLRR